MNPLPWENIRWRFERKSGENRQKRVWRSDPENRSKSYTQTRGAVSKSNENVVIVSSAFAPRTLWLPLVTSRLTTSDRAKKPRIEVMPHRMPYQWTSGRRSERCWHLGISDTVHKTAWSINQNVLHTLYIRSRMHDRVVRLNKNTQLCVNPWDEFSHKFVHHYNVNHYHHVNSYFTARRAVNISFGVHLAEKIMKIVNRLVQIASRFGPNSARIVLSKDYVDWGTQTKLQCKFHSNRSRTRGAKWAERRRKKEERRNRRTDPNTINPCGAGGLTKKAASFLEKTMETN